MASSRFWVRRELMGQTFLMDGDGTLAHVYDDEEGKINIEMWEGYTHSPQDLREIADVVDRWFGKESSDALQAEGAPGSAQAERDG